MSEEDKQDFTINGRKVKLDKLEVAAQKSFLRNWINNAGIYNGRVDTFVLNCVLSYWPIPVKAYSH